MKSDQRTSFRTGIAWSLIAGIVLAVGVIVGIVQNSQAADVHYLGWTVHTSLAVLLLATVVATVALSSLAGLVWRWERRRRVSRRVDLERLRDSSRMATPASRTAPPAQPEVHKP